MALGVKSMENGADKLVRIDVNPASSRYGRDPQRFRCAAAARLNHMGFKPTTGGSSGPAAST